MVRLKYSQIMNFGFAQAMGKITQTPMHGTRASIVHKMGKKLSRARAQIMKEFQRDIVEVYASRDTDGKIIRPDENPGGFEPIEEKREEFSKAQDAFGERVAEVDCPKITVELISDVKVSAQDLEAFADLYEGYEPEEKQPDVSGVPADSAPDEASA